MGKDAHILIRRKKGKMILEYGWDECEVDVKRGNFCLTKPWRGGSLNRPHSGEWMVWDLKNKNLIAEFQKRKYAFEYFHWFISNYQ